MSQSGPLGNLGIGKGKLYFGVFADGTQTANGQRPLGNCPGISQSVEEETLDHFSSEEGIRQKDEQFIIEVGRMINVECDNISRDNLALFFLGQAALTSEAGSTGNTDAFASVVAGNRYQVGVSASNPAGARKLANVVVTDGDVTTYVLNTDYTLDADRGAITIIDGGSISTGDSIEVEYDVTAHTRDTIISNDTMAEGELRFESFNPKGPRRDQFFPRVKITPNGEYNLISDDWQTISLQIEVLKKDGMAMHYVDGQPVTS
jgi:hypothetical protein